MTVNGDTNVPCHPRFNPRLDISPQPSYYSCQFVLFVFKIKKYESFESLDVNSKLSNS